MSWSRCLWVAELHVVPAVLKADHGCGAAKAVLVAVIVRSDSCRKFDCIVSLGRPSTRPIKEQARPYALDQYLHSSA